MLQQSANDSRSPTRGAKDRLRFRHPRREDGQAVHDLIASCEALDGNSLYCNFLQCTHFSETCMLAEEDGKILGWVSAYIPPKDPGTLFVWQVAVAEAARGRKLARRLIAKLLDSEGCEEVERIKTTITPDNRSSWRMFEGLADQFGAEVSDTVWLCEKKHFAGQHDSEHMLTIAPIGSPEDETRPAEPVGQRMSATEAAAA